MGTHKVNIWLSDRNDLSADATIANTSGSPLEILGGGAANTDSTDSASAEDIDMTEAGEVWVCTDTVRNTMGDAYIYVCNAVNNGTADATSGILSVIVEYYGKD